MSPGRRTPARSPASCGRPGGWAARRSVPAWLTSAPLRSPATAWHPTAPSCRFRPGSAPFPPPAWGSSSRVRPGAGCGSAERCCPASPPWAGSAASSNARPSRSRSSGPSPGWPGWVRSRSCGLVSPGPWLSGPVMIEVDQLSKRFGPVTAVDGLSFAVRPGHVTGFLGANGAGKTTTMRVVLGLDAPTSGTALIGGRRYPEIIRPLHEAGALLDATAVHGGRTAWFHLLSIAQSNGIGRRRVMQVLQLTGLEAVAGRRVKGFSLGMKQRLGIAAALLGDPPVLIFDEPVNGLDAEGVRWIRQLFRSLG